MQGVKLHCNFHDARSKFYRAFNAMYGKIGQSASLESLFHLLKSKCRPIPVYLLYGTEAANLTAGQKHSLDFAITRIMMKVVKLLTKASFMIAKLTLIFYRRV